MSLPLGSKNLKARKNRQDFAGALMRSKSGQLGSGSDRRTLNKLPGRLQIIDAVNFSCLGFTRRPLKGFTIITANGYMYLPVDMHIGSLQIYETLPKKIKIKSKIAGKINQSIYLKTAR